MTYSEVVAKLRHRLSRMFSYRRRVRRITQNRGRENIRYCRKTLSQFNADEFEVVVAIEVVEHLSKYSAFPMEVTAVAPTAKITTPNKDRNPFDSVANTPAYDGHVREWTCGEFCWVLRAFYSDVEMYTIKGFAAEVERFKINQYLILILTRCSGLDHSESLFALCRQPVRRLVGTETKVESVA